MNNMNYQPTTRDQGFTLIELLVVISIIGFIAVSSVVAFNTVRKNARDAARAGNVATLKRALTMYLNDSPTGYPLSTGECLKASAGVGSDLLAAKVLLAVPTDPLWPTTAPAHTNGLPDADQNNFCFFYYSDDNRQYKISFFLESNSKAGEAGINTTTQ